MEWEFVDKLSTMRRLCEEQIYGAPGVRNREFILIAFGWMWGKSQDNLPFIEGTCHSGMLMIELDAMYKIVARENGWHNV